MFGEVRRTRRSKWKKVCTRESVNIARAGERAERGEKNITRQLVHLEFFSSLSPSRLVPQWTAQFTWPSGLSAFTATFLSKVQVTAGATREFSLSLSLNLPHQWSQSSLSPQRIFFPLTKGNLSFNTSQDKVLLAPPKRVISPAAFHYWLHRHLHQLWPQSSDREKTLTKIQN